MRFFTEPLLSNKRIFKAFCFVAGLNLAAMLFFYAWSVRTGHPGLLPSQLGGADDGAGYLARAWLHYRNMTNYQDNAWVYVMVFIMRMGFGDPFWMKLCLSIVAILCLLAGLKLYSIICGQYRSEFPTMYRRGAVVAVLLMGLYPSFIFFCTCSLVRDAWIYSLHLWCCVLLFIILSRKDWLLRAVLLVFLLPMLYALYKFRFYATLSVLFGMVMWGLYYSIKAFARAKLAATATCAWAVVILPGAAVAPYAINVVLGGARAEAITEFRSGTIKQGVGKSNLGIDLLSAPWPTKLPLFLYSLVSNAVGPLPWQISSAVGAANFLVEFPLFMATLWYLWKRRKHVDPAIAFLLFEALAWFSLIAFSNDNVGNATRLRVLGWNLVFVATGCLVCKGAIARWTLEHSASIGRAV